VRSTGIRAGLLGALGLLALATCGGGGTASGSLFVLVTDAAGSAIAGAAVSTTPATQSLTTDMTGTAFFSTVAAGGYAVTAVHPTAGSGRSTCEVKANDVAQVTIKLIPGVTLPTTGQAGAGGAGGAASGGSVGAGGAATGGSVGTGGAASGGSVGTGGAAPGGSVGTGGAATGGRGGAGGVATGGRGGAGGVATGGRGGAGGVATGGAIGTGGIGGSAGAGGSAGTGGNSGVLVLAPPTKDQIGVNLSWTVAPGNIFATFKIYRSSTVINILQDGTATQYRDQTVQLGVSYSYQIGGVTAGGVQILSNTQTIVAGVYIDVGSQIERMKIDPKRPYLYGVDRVNNSLHFIDLNTNTVDKTIYVGSTPVDLDINLEGTTLYVANFGSTEIAMVDLTTQALAGSIFVDTTVGTWSGNPYRLVCTAGDTLVYTSNDQWQDVKLVDATTGTTLSYAGSIYAPALAASPDGTIVYAGGTDGLNNLTRFNIVNNMLQSVDGSQSSGSSPVIASRDGQYVFASAQKLLAKNLMTVLGTFSEPILAINNDGSLAVSSGHIFDGTTFSAKRTTPLSTSTMAMSADGTTLYLYDTTSSRIYVASLL
jgi:YVTN family beta-propeller protein